MAELFGNEQAAVDPKTQPLAERMRPRVLEEFVGQPDLIGPKGSLSASTNLRNMLLWGPPGSGKTTLAKLLAKRSGMQFETLSATSSGVKEVREVIERASHKRRNGGGVMAVFIDEIHRFNKGQQDALLQASENGTIVLIGATTENPSFEVNSALLSRCVVHVLKPLETPALETLLQRALTDSECGLHIASVSLTDDARALLLQDAGGDARRMLGVLEIAADNVAQLEPANRIIDRELMQRALGRRMLRHDKKGESHYDLASAMIKSVRGSDPDAAIYYCMRMIDGGEDVNFVARRLAILASEDIGNADPSALTLAASAVTVINFIGMPEARYTLVQLAAYLALAPKSNAAAQAMQRASELIKATGELPVPLKLRNARTELMRGLGYGKDYNYAHDQADAFSPETYLPDEIKQQSLYEPTERGYEARLKERLAALRNKVKVAGQPRQEGRGS